MLIAGVLLRINCTDHASKDHGGGGFNIHTAYGWPVDFCWGYKFDGYDADFCLLPALFDMAFLFATVFAFSFVCEYFIRRRDRRGVIDGK